MSWLCTNDYAPRYTTARRELDVLRGKLRAAEDRHAAELRISTARVRAAEKRATQLDEVLSETGGTFQPKGGGPARDAGQGDDPTAWFDPEYAWQQYLEHGSDTFLHCAMLSARGTGGRKKGEVSAL